MERNIFTPFPLPPCHAPTPLVVRSHEKGAYLDEIKRPMRGSGLGLEEADDGGQNRQGENGKKRRGGGSGEGLLEDSEAGRRCLGRLDMGGILIWV